MTTEERKELNRLLRMLWQKLVQVVVQSRLGEKTNTLSKSPSKSSVMFNLEIEDNAEISQEVKKTCGSQFVSPEKPFSIEILLRTKEGETMVLEVWTLSMEESFELSPMNMFPAVYDRMCIILKSAICVSRITPAWKLSFRQGPDSYIICYKLYIGEPQYNSLGEKPVTHRIGQINILSAHLSLHVTYRMNLTLSSPPRISPYDQMMLKSDHFKVDNSPRHLRRVGERVLDSSDAIQNSDESQDGVKPIAASPPYEFRSGSPSSRTSSDSSHRGSLSQLPMEKIYVPFATQRPIASEYLSDLPLTNFITTAAEKAEECRQEIKELKEKRIQESKAPKMSRTDKMNTSTHSNKSSASTATKDEADYVVVDLKTPFVGSDDSDVELTSFYKGVQSAPQLHSFSDQSPFLLDVTEELKKFEICADDYDDLVKSFTTDSHSSLELS